MSAREEPKNGLLIRNPLGLDRTRLVNAGTSPPRTRGQRCGVLKGMAKAAGREGGAELVALRWG